MKAHAVQPACPRLFEVEALRDGRLSGAEVTRFHNHVRSCSVCAQEMQALATLADALRDSPASPEADELHVRRERTRLLAAFDASLMPAPNRGRTQLWLGAAAGFALVALVALVTLLRSPAPPVAAALEAVKVQAATSAKWSRRAENQLEVITLEAGTLSIRVDHQLSHRPLLVLLPDGELEDIGTTFSVTAASAHTTQVTVQDGSVILRLRDAPALTLRAGDSWPPAPAPVVASAPAPSQPPAPLVHSAQTPNSVAAKPALSSPQSTAAVTAVAAPAVPALPDAPAANHADPSADFRAAMSAFTGGDNARASSLFAAFLGQHPSDSRAEDAAYLRILALQRAHDSAGMIEAANAYLRRYPHGFRHAEVESLAR